MELKKHFLIFAAIGILLTSISCLNNTEDKIIRIGFSQCVSDHPWRVAMNHSIKVQSSLYPQVDLKIYEARKDLQLQIEHIEKMIADNMDVIIISPMESELMAPVIVKAYDQGIPVILIDRKINSEKYTAFIGADNLEVGRNAGSYISASSSEITNVIELKIGDNASPSVERSQGFHEVVAKNKNINVVASIDYTNPVDHDRILTSVLDSLENTSIDYFYAFNDLLAYESWQIARRKGLKDKIKFIGVDGLNGDNGGIDLVRNGILDASIFYPTGGAEAIKLAMQIVNGNEVPKVNILGTTVIDERNADIMKNQLDRINEQLNDIEQQSSALIQIENQYSAQNNLLKVAITFLAIILSLTVYSIYSMLTIRKKNKQLLLKNKKITIQRNQIEKIAEEVKESNEAKFNFFTGLSHEFKTPITLIMSSIESLREGLKDKKGKYIYELDLINNNSSRLLRLINNLLDFRKSEDKKFNLRASETNIYKFSKGVFDDFQREAKKRGIRFTLDSNNKDLKLFIDRNLMDKVYFNLFSNAFKFTPDNGIISLEIIDNPELSYALIVIKDNGIGIPQKEVPHVFEPFFKGSNNRKNSSGVGLHLSKQFVELHLGEINVESHNGTFFNIKLFKGSTHFNEDQIIVEPAISDSSMVDFSLEFVPMEDSVVVASKDSNEKHSVLIIEDNKDLSTFLKNKLNKEFEIILSDGTDSLEKAFEYIPDIVICDVNLPEKDGFEICTTLKADLRTSHIPTIILTALGDKESYLKGLSSGADLYLTKPFSFSILTQSIKSLLYNREKLRYYYTNNVFRVKDEQTLGDFEQKFIFELNKTIKANIDNSNFSVERLAESMGVSRVQLYRKIKAIFGIGVNDYINNLRLEKSKSLLENSKLSISEIAYSSGFSSPNYFSTAFKGKFGISPAQYRKGNKTIASSS